jgi:hypothetical protein
MSERRFPPALVRRGDGRRDANGFQRRFGPGSGRSQGLFVFVRMPGKWHATMGMPRPPPNMKVVTPAGTGSPLSAHVITQL